MTELTELETLQKAVVDIEASFVAALDATDWADDDTEVAAYSAWCKARLELKYYLKEQDND
tara:strand:+ start:508 stop:690 length:183 start_codon:yes stop_codon:yes gene_type:complete